MLSVTEGSVLLGHRHACAPADGVAHLPHWHRNFLRAGWLHECRWTYLLFGAVKVGEASSITDAVTRYDPIVTTMRVLKVFSTRLKS